MTRRPLLPALCVPAVLLLLPTVPRPPFGPARGALSGSRKAQIASQTSRDFEALPFAPPHYVCYRAGSPPTIDGRLNEAAWSAAPWTDLFVDIEGPSRPQPRFRTRTRMLWDADYFYIAAEMEEPDLWGTLTERDSIVYNDNDFEIFIDPDGDTQLYYELEVNPLGTVFDLLLPRTYRDGGPPIIAWDIAGLRLAVDARGTINHPGDRDEGWTVEMAMPWKVLREAAPGKRPPRTGDQWRVNFSRVEWQVEEIDGRYRKRVNPTGGKPVPSDNWVWAPQGLVDMHMPERWGYVQFAGTEAGAGIETFVDDPNDAIKWALRRLYYRQRRFRGANGRYADDLAALGLADIRIETAACTAGNQPAPPACRFSPTIQPARDLYQIDVNGFSGMVHIQQDGRVWVTR